MANPKTKLASGLIPSVAYYRMSSKKQDKSIPAQRVEVEKYAREKGYGIIRWEPYVDEGISGAESDKREGFKRLMKDAIQSDDFEVILCWDQDRFSRFDPLEANFYWYQLREAGVRIVTVRQGELDLSQLGGWLMASINQHGKAQYLRDISANVLRGRLRKAEQGLWIGSRAPYGYAIDDGRLILGDDEHVEAVKFIFRDYVDRDTSLREIAKQLNDRGIPSPSGRTWHGSKVQAILRREAYATGRVAQLRESKGKFHTVKGRSVVPSEHQAASVVKPESEWFYVDCPTIIDENTWQQAAAKLKRRQGRTTPVRGGGTGLLNGLLYCGHCGARMAPDGKPLDSSGDVIYCCQTYNVLGKGACNRNLIHQSAILPFLVGKIQELLLAPRNSKRFDKEVRRKLASTSERRPGEDRRVRAGIGRLDAEIKAAVAELKRTPDDLYEMAVADVRELRAKREVMAGELAVIDAATNAPGSDDEARAREAVAKVKQLGEMMTAADPAVVREALSRICERIDLWYEHKKGPKSVRSYFRRGIVTFRQPSGLSDSSNRLD